MEMRPEHVRFLHRVRRRWIAWRTIEIAGIGASIASIIAIIVVLILLLRGEPAVASATLLLAIGVVTGSIFGLTRRPTLLQTAMMADEQLGLHDLLSSTLQKQDCGDDIFRRVVLAQAEVICSTRSPNELIVQRLGGRAWGGIGITSALVMTLALMSSQPDVTVARDTSISGKVVDRVAAAADQPTETRIETQPYKSTARQNSALKPADLGLDEASGDRWPSQQSSDKSNHRNGHMEDGAGSEVGRSDDFKTALFKPADRPNIPDRDLGKSALSNAGQGRATNEQDGQPGDESVTGTGQSKSVSIPSANTSNSSANPSQVDRRGEMGEIPESYRDLIRSYFELPTK